MIDGGKLMKLYKYCTVNEYTLKNLKQNELYFNRVNRVNDPYEGIHKFNIKKELELDFIKLIYQHRYDEKLFSTMPNKDILQQIVHDGANSFLQDSGLSCFSETNESLVMWGNYADNQQGMCVEYDKDIGIFTHAEKVTYSNDVFTIRINKPSQLTELDMMKAGAGCLYNKHRQWKYEKEWRIIFKPSESFQYPPEAITGIYFGLRISEEDKIKVYEATKHLKHLKYYIPDIYPDRYKMTHKEIKFKSNLLKMKS